MFDKNAEPSPQQTGRKAGGILTVREDSLSVEDERRLAQGLTENMSTQKMGSYKNRAMEAEKMSKSLSRLTRKLSIS